MKQENLESQSPWNEFILSLDQYKDTEYGDFKREMDSHLRRLVEATPTLNEKQMREIVKIRQDYLWEDHEDEEIDLIKKKLRQRIHDISILH